jgi:hypothetical protein
VIGFVPILTAGSPVAIIRFMDTGEPCDENTQLQRAATYFWPRMGRRTEYLRLCRDLQEIGYDGCIGSLSAEDVINGWKEAGWIVFSPDRTELRVTDAGKAQLDAWQDADRLWQTGGTDDMPLSKRLVAGEPARNIRKIRHEIGNATVTGMHDPYTRADSLSTILQLADIGAKFSPSFRILGSPLAKATEKASLVGLLSNINAERKTNWEVRTYATTGKPHRRFLIFDDGSILTCGMSLNNVNKDEVLARIAAGSEYARHDRQFFDDKWKQGQPL